MKKLLRIAIFITLGLAQTLAASQTPEILTGKERGDLIAKVQGYLNGLKRLKAHLVQTNADGSVMSGTLYLDKPGKIRLSYEGASPVLMIADGTNFIYQEGDQDPTSYAIDSTPASILLRDSLTLQNPERDVKQGDIDVLGVTRWQGTVAVKVVRSGSDESMALTLMFMEQGTGLSLLGWLLRQQGQQTDVRLSDQEVPSAIDPRLFEWGVIK